MAERECLYQVDAVRVRYIAGTMSDDRRDAVLRAAMVVGLLPLPAERTRLRLNHGNTFDFEEGLLAPGCPLPPPARPILVTRKERACTYVSHWPRMKALCRTADISYGLDDNGWWTVEMTTPHGSCTARPGPDL